MSLLSKLSDWFGNLQPREQKVVAGGATLIILSGLWVMFDARLSERAALQERVSSLTSDMGLMQAQSEVLLRMQNSCQQLQLTMQDPRDFMSRQAERNRLQVTELTARSAVVTRLVVTGADGNAMLRLGHQLLCQGYGLNAIEITRNADTGSYRALLEVQHGS